MKGFGALMLAVACVSCGGGTGDTTTAAQDGVPAAEATTPADASAPAVEATRSVVPSRTAAPSRAAAPVRSAPASAHAEAPASAARPARAAEPVAVVREFTLPAGTTLRMELKSAVASDTSAVEDSIRATLRQAVTIDGATVLPAGTELTGTVTDVERAGRVKGRSRVAFQFNSLRHDGERYDIRTEAIAREGEATKGKDAKKIAIGAGVGAAVGALIGGGDGAAKGAAVGGAGGTGMVLATRGEEVRLGLGEDVATQLTAPLTIRVEN